MFSNPLRQPESVDCAGHFDIAENNVHGRLSVQEHGHRLVCIDSFNDLVPAVPKVLRNGHANQNFVLYKEDCLLKGGLVSHVKLTSDAGRAFLSPKAS